MQEFRILVEGISDHAFISYLLKDYINKIPQNFIINTEGKDKIKLFESSLLLENNYFIFDADQDLNEARKNIIQQINHIQISGTPIKYEIFLLPNNKDLGELETLLFSIIRNQSDKEERLECLEKYWQCLPNIPKKNDYDVRLYEFITSYNLNKDQKEEIKKKNYLFDREDIWDMESKELEPLKSYLNPIINLINSSAVDF